jgi:hypothetical protein
LSGACVVGRCRVVPLANGERCESSDQCLSEFCNLSEDIPKCVTLPLPLGARCASNGQCESGVCFDTGLMGEETCIRGLDEGEACGDSDQPPCNPNRYYCDTMNEDPPVCVPLRESGEDCDPAMITIVDPAESPTTLQCRSRECVVHAGRHMCAAAIPEDAAFCDGGDFPRPAYPAEPDQGQP